MQALISDSSFWDLQTRDPDAQVPITINCWPSNSGGESFVNLEYECNTSLELQEVSVVIPLPNLKSAPRINSVRLLPAMSQQQSVLHF